MNIWYVNHYASPPGAGRGERPVHIARMFHQHGHQCTVIGAGQHHLQYPEARPPTETPFCEDGIQFFLLPTSAYSGNSLLRLWNMVSFGRQVSGLARFVQSGVLPKPDAIIASSPTPFVWDGVQKPARLLQSRTLFEERDLWPRSLVEIAGVHPWNPVVLWMQQIVNHACRNADAVVSLLPLAFEELANRGLSRDRFHWIPNGIREEAWTQAEGASHLPRPHADALEQCRSNARLVVVYAGAHGPANDLEQLCTLPKGADTERPYHILCVGDGPSKEALIELARERRLTCISFLPPLPKMQLRSFLQLADAAVITLKDTPLFRFGVSPNKLFDYMMARLPVVWAVRAGNSPVKEAEAGIVVEPGNVAQLDQALRQLHHMGATERRMMGQRGREFVLRQHSWRVLGQQYVNLCERLCGKGDGEPPRA